MVRPIAFAACVLAVLASGCDQLGIESPTVAAARRDADGKAVGAACRHAGRALEDCYTMNRKVDRAAIFAGWRDMDDYMRENKLDSVAPQVKSEPPATARAAAEDDDETSVKAEAKSKKSRAGTS